MRSKLMATVLAALTLPALAVTFTVDSVKQRYPWNGLVDLDYTVTYGPDEAELDPKTNRLEVVVRDMGTDPAQTVLLTGFDTFPLPLAAGTHHVVWRDGRFRRHPGAVRAHQDAVGAEVHGDRPLGRMVGRTLPGDLP